MNRGVESNLSPLLQNPIAVVPLNKVFLTYTHKKEQSQRQHQANQHVHNEILRRREERERGTMNI